MHKLSYKVGCVKCPIKNDGTEINSLNCKWCDHFVASNSETSILVCDAELECPHCGTIHNDLSGLQDCVRKCHCEHKWRYKLYSMSGEEMELERRCSVCNKFEEICLHSDDFTQTMMEQIWNG